MRDFFLRFWTDPAYFTALCRALLYLVSKAIADGKINLGEWNWIGNLGEGAAFLMPSSTAARGEKQAEKAVEKQVEKVEKAAEKAAETAAATPQVVFVTPSP